MIEDELDSAAEPDDAIRPVTPSEIRAGRRLTAIAVVWAWELACALLIATPMHAWARRTWGVHPDGDAVLFRPGGHALLSWLGDSSPALSIVVRTSLVLLVVFGVLGQFVTGALVASLLAERRKGQAPPASFALQVGARAFLPLVTLLAFFGAIEGLLVGVGMAASSAAGGALNERIGDAHAFDVRVAVLVFFVLLALLIGVVADLARVAIVRDVAFGQEARSVGQRVRSGIGRTLQNARASLGRAALAWGWRAGLTVMLVCAGGFAGDVAGARGGAVLWALFVVHQLVVLARVALRASWFASALRLACRMASTERVTDAPGACSAACVTAPEEASPRTHTTQN